MSSVKRTAAFTTFGASLHAAQFARGSNECPRRSVQRMLRHVALLAGLDAQIPASSANVGATGISGNRAKVPVEPCAQHEVALALATRDGARYSPVATGREGSDTHSLHEPL